MHQGRPLMRELTVLGQTTTLFGFFYVPSSFMCGGEGDKVNHLMSLPDDTIIWTKTDDDDDDDDYDEPVQVH